MDILEYEFLRFRIDIYQIFKYFQSGDLSCKWEEWDVVFGGKLRYSQVYFGRFGVREYR